MSQHGPDSRGKFAVAAAAAFFLALLTRLHAHKGAPDEDSRTIQQASNHVAEYQDDVGPVPVHIATHVPTQVAGAPFVRFSAAPPVSAEKRCFLVHAVRGVSMRYAAAHVFY